MTKLVGHSTAQVYGPFHRAASETQDPAAMVEQLLTGELWGKKGRYGLEPAAKAYRGPLPHGIEGFEFWAFAPPDNAAGHPVFWSQPGEYLVSADNLGVVKLKIAFVKVTQSLHAHAK
jgi:hypothetical protein